MNTPSASTPPPDAILDDSRASAKAELAELRIRFAEDPVAAREAQDELRARMRAHSRRVLATAAEHLRD